MVDSAEGKMVRILKIACLGKGDLGKKLSMWVFLPLVNSCCVRLGFVEKRMNYTGA